MEKFTYLEPETMLPEHWFAPKPLGKAQQPGLVKGLLQRPAVPAAGAQQEPPWGCVPPCKA